MNRRQLLCGTAAICASSAISALPPVKTPETDLISAPLKALEEASGGRLGVCIVDTATGREYGLRMNERFGMCSTFKLPLAAIILREADLGNLSLDYRVAFGAADMLSYAPATRENLEAGSMTVRDLAEAAQVTSDNVAANLLLRLIGGPEGFTAKLRFFGDEIIRLDRIEPDLNVVPPGELRDTATPRAMAKLVEQIFTAGLLTDRSVAVLKGWTVNTHTGLKRLRGGLPADWIVGDKTGTGLHPSMTNKHNDVAVCWPPGRDAPIIITAYYEAPAYFETPRDQDDGILRAVAKIVATNLRWSG